MDVSWTGCWWRTNLNPKKSSDWGWLEVHHIIIYVIENDEESTLIGLACGLCFDFNQFEKNIFLVGTEEGKIHKCSRAYSGQYQETYQVYHHHHHDRVIYWLCIRCVGTTSIQGRSYRLQQIGRWGYGTRSSRSRSCASIWACRSWTPCGLRIVRQVIILFLEYSVRLCHTG